jgi:hypothetical protein
LTALLIGTTGCGPELERVSKLETLRILGLRKSAPYAKPGEKVTVSLLWEDTKGAAPRPVERFIGFWCVNPPGDLYSQCLTGNIARTPLTALNQDTLTLEVPKDAIRLQTSDPTAPPYGIAYVFYAVCAGKFGTVGVEGTGGAGGASSAPSGVTFSGLPTCYTAEGEVAGADDFVMGYSSIFVYEDFRNKNPIIQGFEVGGKRVDVDCIDDECVGKPSATPALDGCAPGVACIEACKDDGAETCPAVTLKPLLDTSIAEQDEVSKVAYNEVLTEGIWVSYYTDRGAVGAEVRLVNDATTGWNKNYETKFYAPKKKGPMRVWATVRDNRGGISWVRVPVYVK